MASWALLHCCALLMLVYVTADYFNNHIDPTISKHVITNRTKLGNNLCNVCKSVIFQCDYNITVDCSYASGNNMGYYQNGTAFWRNTTSYSGHRQKRASRFLRKSSQYRKNRRHRSSRRRTSTTYYSTLPPPSRCLETVSKTCVEDKCELQCCDGSLIDTKTQSCERYGNPMKCHNGGTISKRKNDCICPKGFLGKACQHRECSLKCQNGGACHTRTGNQTKNLADTSYNDDHCVCPAYTTGKFCETILCRYDCQNNGTCQSRHYWAHCICPEGFYGRFCEKTHKEGVCPPLYKTACRFSMYHFGFYCWRDESCPGQQKCCRNACGRRTCLNPFHENSTCTYGNETYAVGSFFSPDPCRLCSCNSSHSGTPHGVVECAQFQCPEMPKYCTNVTTPVDECCPVCNDDPDVAMCAGNYTEPYFVNCPDMQVTIDVGPDTDTAPVDIGLLAKDCKGDKLKVFYSADRLKAGKGEENFRLVSATTSRDDKGNYAECFFHVRIRDRFPPKFLTCPTDFSQPSPGEVTWEVPTAKDNVGLAILPTSRRHPGDKVSAGDFMVEYWTEDFQGNIGKCSFVISVGSNMNQGDSDRQISSKKKRYDLDADKYDHPAPLPASHADLPIILVVGSTVIVVALIGMAFFFYRRQRKMVKNAATAAAAAAASVAAANNSAQSASVAAAASLGDRWNGGMFPQYSLPPDNVMSPPSYSQTDETLAAAGGGLTASGGQEAGELPSKKSMS